MKDKTRAFDMTIDIDAPVDAVWKALSDADEVTRWFATRAAITPGKGGPYTLSWDGAWEWKFEVDTWEPNKRLRIVDRKASPFHGDGQPMEQVAPAEVAIDFTLEGKSGRTLLRIVHSGFGQGAAWDDEIDGVSHGWNNELRGLRHYLEHHRGQDRRMVWVSTTVGLPVDETWRRLTGPGGFVTSDQLAWLHGGDRARMTVAGAEELSGDVLLSIPGRALALAAEQYDNGLFRVHVDRAGGKSMIFIGLAAWGASAAKVEGFRQRAQHALAEALAVEIGT